MIEESFSNLKEAYEKRRILYTKLKEMNALIAKATGVQSTDGRKLRIVLRNVETWDVRDYCCPVDNPRLEKGVEWQMPAGRWEVREVEITEATET